MPTLYFLIGVPGSGKSTLAQKMRLHGCAVVSTDAIRVQHYRQVPEPRRSELAFIKAREFMVALLGRGRNVVFDATNTITRYRAPILEEMRPYATEIVAVVMDTPLHVCQQWHTDRQARGERCTLQPEVIYRMARQLAENQPTPEEFDKIVSSTEFCQSIAM